jgi:hypothetical protein
MKRVLPLVFGCALSVAMAADRATLERGQKEEQRGCLPCHSLRLIHSQRLSRAAWDRELTKMAGWGANIQDRDAILEYLVANFGNDKQPSPPVMSLDGSKRQ